MSRMLAGVLIAESLRVGSALSDVPWRVTRIRRIHASGATGDQPRYWTLIDFEAEETHAQRLADALAGCLRSTGGWYADFTTSTEAFVVFADRVFRYRRGESREQVEEYARSVGVPEHQLDWEDRLLE